MKVYKIICRGGQTFYCETYNQLSVFVKNYPLPDVRVEGVEMSEEKYRKFRATTESRKYFKEDQNEST